MSEHPCKGMNRAQREAFEMIAVSQHPRCKPQTIAALLARGVVTRGPDEILGRDALGQIAVPTYYVPMQIYMQWCDWCSEQPENQEAAE